MEGEIDSIQGLTKEEIKKKRKKKKKKAKK